MNRILFAILMMLPVLMPLSASAQWSFDIASVEAYISDHKHQKSLLLARSTLEMSNQLLHEYSAVHRMTIRNSISTLTNIPGLSTSLT